MGSFALILLGGGAGLVLLLLALGRANEMAAQSWEPLLSPGCQRALEDLRRRFEQDRAAVDFSYELAEEARRADDPGELARMMQAGYEYITDTAPGRLHLLRMAATYSRLVTAMIPVPALRPASFELGEIRARAGWAALLHHLLVTLPERFRLRVVVLGYGVGVVVKTLAGLQGRPLDGPGWRRLQAARTDWHTISDETLESFRVLVTTVARVAPAPVRARP